LIVDHKLKKERKNRILEAATVVFSQKGYAGASVADIAAQADVGKGTIYEYFDSKEDLFFAVFEWYQKKTGAEATVGISVLGASAADRLQALNNSLMSMWDEMKDVFVLVMEFWAASSSSNMRERFQAAFKQLYQDYRRIVSDLIVDGISRGEFRDDIDPEIIAAALVGTWDALFLQAWFDDSFDLIATSKGFLDTVLRGLAV
jgi:AcrR family transcriptional regulator